MYLFHEDYEAIVPVIIIITQWYNGLSGRKFRSAALNTCVKLRWMSFYEVKTALNFLLAWFTAIRWALERWTQCKTNIRKDRINSSSYSRCYCEACNKGGVFVPGLAPKQRSLEETSPLCQAVVDSVSDLTSPGIEPQPSRTNSDVLKTELTGQYDGACYYC